MRRFDYSFLNNGLLPASLVNITASIASLKTMSGIRKAENIRIFTELEAIAKIQSVKSSNAIEGIVTSDERIAAIVNQNSAPLNHNEAEIAGYRDALNEIHLGYEHINFRQKVILRLHEIMMSVAGVILDFLCIHPFRDGNGRMSRLLSLLLLYKNGYDVGKYVSFEEQINKQKAYYYEALRKSSEGWHTNENNYFPFIENFLTTLFSVVNGKKITKKARIEATVLNSLTPLSKAEICAILPDVSPTTVEAVLGAMVRDGSIVRIGSARASRYMRR